MKLINLKQKIGGAILTASLLFGIGAAASVSAQGQYRGEQNRRDREYEREQRQREREQRRREREYRRDQRDNRDNDDRDDRYEDNDYNNGRYQRRGRNWDGYGNYGGSYQLRQTALNAGYNEGIREGRKDRDHRDRFDFSDEGAYRSASKDYNSRLGDRYAYQQYFRQAFETGYRDGYYGY